uniref:Lipocalin/cytosolic fatty-acid binding domain-containing protein n=1 Tax=Amblyomma maculatum TaxID=34609 RepID=G3MKW1_AMBMU
MKRLCVLWTYHSTAICFYIGAGLGASLTDNGENLNITKVLETNETLWVYWETTKHFYDVCTDTDCIQPKDTCDRNIKTGFSDKYYNYTRAMIEERSQYGTAYSGKFVEPYNIQYPPKSMVVTTIYGSPDPHLYTLEYTDDLTFNCSVFYIYSLNNRISKFELETCEMLITDSAVDYGPSESCMTYFQRRCNGTKIYQPYKADCKKHINK